MATASLSTEQSLDFYLEARGVKPKNVILLTGGTANFVYRVTLPEDKTVIYKHAAPYLHSNTNFAFDPVRMDYEDRALEILPPLLSKQLPESRVRPAAWYSYDKEAKLLCIEDGGERNLKFAYADPKLDIAAIGKELGRWIAALHLCSTQTSLSLSDPSDLKANNPIASIYRYAYMNLPSALTQYGHDASLGERINEEFGSLLATENECICHGDFWTGNVLVKFRDSEERKLGMTIVDWEMVRRGTSATDVAQFAAESFLSDRFKGARSLLPVFLDAYLEAREKSGSGSKMDRKWVIRMTVHWATHIAFWPTMVEWTDKEGTGKLVEIGVGVLRAALGEDWGQLRRSELFKDVGEGWANAWART